MGKRHTVKKGIRRKNLTKKYRTATRKKINSRKVKRKNKNDSPRKNRRPRKTAHKGGMRGSRGTAVAQQGFTVQPVQPDPTWEPFKNPVDALFGASIGQSLVRDERKFPKWTPGKGFFKRLGGDATQKDPENLLHAEKTEALMLLLSAGSGGAIPVAFEGIDALGSAVDFMTETGVKALGSTVGAGFGQTRGMVANHRIKKTRSDNGITFKQLYDTTNDPKTSEELKISERQAAFGNVGGKMDNRQTILSAAADDDILTEEIEEAFSGHFVEYFRETYDEFLGEGQHTQNSVWKDIVTACRTDVSVSDGIQHGFMRVMKMFLLNDWCLSCITVARRTALHGLYIRAAIWGLTGEPNDLEDNAPWTANCKIEYDHGLEQMIELLPNFLHSKPGSDERTDDYTNAQYLAALFDKEFKTGSNSYFEGCKKVFMPLENHQVGESLEAGGLVTLKDMLAAHFLDQGVVGVMKYIASHPCPGEEEEGEGRLLNLGGVEFRSLAIDAVLIISFLRLLVPVTTEGVGANQETLSQRVSKSIIITGPMQGRWRDFPRPMQDPREDFSGPE